MKRLSFLFVFPFLSACFCHAQSPERLNYQAVVRNASGSLVSNQATGMRISILKGTATGASVYTETHTKTSNANGLITLEIGGGTAASGNFNLINWGEGPYFIKTETDPTGGTNYLLVATSQLLSVPYSLFAQSASLKASSIGDTLFSGKQFVVVPGLSNANSQDNPANGTALVLTRPVSNLTSASVSLSGEVSNGGGSPVTSRGFCYSTTASPTTANNIVAAGSGTGSFTANLSGINPATTYYLRTYAVNASGTSYGNQVLFTTPGAVGQACAQGSTLTVTHTAGDVAPVSKTVTYKIIQTDITRESKCWLAQNLGADRQATSLDDYSEASAGWYWQFGQKRGYKNDGISRVPNTWGNPAPDTSSWLPSNDPCRLLMGQGWRIPTMMEYSFLIQTLNSNSLLFNSALRFHYAGLLRDGVVKNRGIEGYYANIFYYSRGTLIMGSPAFPPSLSFAPHHTDAISMRCIKD